MGKDGVLAGLSDGLLCTRVRRARGCPAPLDRWSGGGGGGRLASGCGCVVQYGPWQHEGRRARQRMWVQAGRWARGLMGGRAQGWAIRWV